MFVAAVRIELRLRGVQSLKEKRHVVKSLSAGLIERFGVAVSEVDDQDKWQKAVLGVAAVAPQSARLTQVLHRIERYLDAQTESEVLRISTTYLERPE